MVLPWHIFIIQVKMWWQNLTFTTFIYWHKISIQVGNALGGSQKNDRYFPGCSNIIWTRKFGTINLLSIIINIPLQPSSIVGFEHSQVIWSPAEFYPCNLPKPMVGLPLSIYSIPVIFLLCTRISRPYLLILECIPEPQWHHPTLSFHNFQQKNAHISLKKKKRMVCTKFSISQRQTYQLISLQLVKNH